MTTTPTRDRLWLGLLTLALVLVCLPRFDRNDWGPIDRFTTDGKPAAENLVDAAHYIDFVRFFRGEVGLDELQAPFSFRPLIPLIAAGVPVRPLTAINLVNVAFLVFGLWALWATLAGVERRDRLLAGLLYVFSFGTFYYGAVGYVDGAVVGLLAVGSWLIVSGRTAPSLAFLALSPFAKEQALALLPVFAVCRLLPSDDSGREGRGERGWGATIVAGAIVAFSFWLSRRLFVAGDGFTWEAAALAYRGNLVAEEVAKYLLGYGLPGALFLYALWSRHDGIRARWLSLAPYTAGFAATLAFALYGRLCCPAGGRLSWLTTPFLIPLAILLITKRPRER